MESNLLKNFNLEYFQIPFYDSIQVFKILYHLLDGSAK